MGILSIKKLGPKTDRNKRITQNIRSAQDEEIDKKDRDKPTLSIFYEVMERMKMNNRLSWVPAPRCRCSGTDYAAWRQLCCSTLRLQGLVYKGKDGSRDDNGKCPKCEAGFEDEIHLLGSCPSTAEARKIFLSICGIIKPRILSRNECNYRHPCF